MLCKEQWAARRAAVSLPACWACMLVALAANAAIAVAPQIGVRAAAIWVLAGAIPGMLTARIALRDEESWVAWIVLAAGLGYAWLAGGMLVLSYLPIPLSRLPILAAYNVVSAALLVLQPEPGASVRRRWPATNQLLAVAALLVIAVILRVWNLGYSEFQGDEVKVMQKAAALVIGRDEALFVHKKGPAEILLSTHAYAVSRLTTEAVARLPFALASVLGALGIYAVGARAHSHRAGWWAFLFVAINGFYVAFARIVQYQGLVLLFGTAGVLFALRFAERDRRSDLWGCALLLACGLLSHSDGVFAVAPAAWIILAAYRRRRAPLQEVARELVGPTLGATMLLALFYVPFVLHPHFETAQEYILRRAGLPPYNNLEHFLTIGSVYNASYYLGLMGAGVLAIVLACLSRLAAPRWLLPAGFVGALAAVTAWPGLLVIGESDYIGVVFAIPLLLAIATPGRSMAWRGMLLWFAVPFIVFGFVFGDPRTHIYTVFPGAALLLGAELDRLSGRRVLSTHIVHALVGTTMAVSLAYLVIVFVSHTPEYRRTYPEHRLRLFWVPYGDEFPGVGLFGFPYRVGWKVIGALYDQGILRGDLGSNEEAHIVGWYTRGQPYCNVDPRYLALAENVQDEQPVSQEMIARAYSLIGQVRVGGEVKLRLYERQPAELTYREYDLEDYAPRFDRQVSGPYYPSGLPVAAPLAGVQHLSTLRLGPDIECLGYSVNTRTLGPGEPLAVTLYWRARAPVAERYTAFVHLEDPGVVWAQKDTPPVCGRQPTDRWPVGSVVEDIYVLVPSENTPPGQHQLVAGMYHPATGQRLPVLSADDYPVSTVLDLGTITYVTAPGG